MWQQQNSWILFAPILYLSNISGIIIEFFGCQWASGTRTKSSVLSSRPITSKITPHTNLSNTCPWQDTWLRDMRLRANLRAGVKQKVIKGKVDRAWQGKITMAYSGFDMTHCFLLKGSGWMYGQNEVLVQCIASLDRA